MRFGRARTTLLRAVIAVQLCLLLTPQTLSQTNTHDLPYDDFVQAPWICGDSKSLSKDLQAFCLKGDVKSVRITLGSYELRDGRWIEDSVSSIANETYDERGNRTELRVWNHASDLNLLEESRTAYEHDAAGRMTGSKAFNKGVAEPIEIATRSYDERGNLIRQETINYERNWRALVTFSYDGENRTIEHTSVNEDYSKGTKQNVRIVYSYAGNISRYVRYSENGNPVSSGESVSDSHGRHLEEEDYQLNARGEAHLTRKVTYKYDSRGLLVEMVNYKADARSGARVVYEYDDKGYAVSMTKYLADGSFGGRGLAKYKFDARGSWVERIDLYQRRETDKPHPILFRRRTITYR